MKTTQAILKAQKESVGSYKLQIKNSQIELLVFFFHLAMSFHYSLLTYKLYLQEDEDLTTFALLKLSEMTWFALSSVHELLPDK